MYRICLVNMPFASAFRPLIALTQLKAVTEAAYPGRVQADVVYLNHDFVPYFGVELYQDIADGPHYLSGLGDWFFRQLAFPELADNATAYLGRYYPYQHADALEFKRRVLEKRAGLGEFLEVD